MAQLVRARNCYHQSIPESSVRFHLKPENSNSNEFQLHRPSVKGTKLLLKVIKAIIIISSQRVSDHLVAYHLVPAITDFISDETRECCNNKFEQTRTLLHGEWSKEIEPSRQSSTHHPLVVSNPLDEKGSERMRRSMQWEAPQMPTAAYDSRLLREQETPLDIGKDWFLD